MRLFPAGEVSIANATNFTAITNTNRMPLTGRQHVRVRPSNMHTYPPDPPSPPNTRGLNLANKAPNTYTQWRGDVKDSNQSMKS